MKIVKPYIAIVVLLICMTLTGIHISVIQHNIRDIRNSPISKLEEKQSPLMDANVILILFSTAAILIGVIWNPKIQKLETNVVSYQEENRVQHTELRADLKKLMAKHDLEASLRELVNNVLMVTTGELSGFVDFEGTLFIDFAKEISNGSFNFESLPSIKTKIYNNKVSSSHKAAKFGKEFAEAHSKSQSECMDKFYKGVEETLLDDVFNSKNKRFRMLCEQFLHAHLTDSVRAYMKIKSHT